MSDESEEASDLIEQLKGTGLFDKFHHNAVVTACVFMASRAIHLGTKFPATACLTVVAKTAEGMLQQEHQNGLLQMMLNAESAPS
jgi:hypothetical protein